MWSPRQTRDCSDEGISTRQGSEWRMLELAQVRERQLRSYLDEHHLARRGVVGEQLLVRRELERPSAQPLTHVDAHYDLLTSVSAGKQ